MTVGIRSHPNQTQNAAQNAYFPIHGQSAGKSPYGREQFLNEQTVPQALYQPLDLYKDLQTDFQNMDPLAYSWYNSTNYPPYNTNIMAFPTMYSQSDYDTTSAVQGNEQAILRQNSIPRGGSLDQYLPEFDYQQVLDNLDLTSYDNPESFCLENFANLDQVNAGVNFDDVAVKQEKEDFNEVDGKNLEELENVLNNNILNANNPMVNTVTTDSPTNNGGTNTVNTNDQSLDEQNLMEILEMYSSANSAEWQPQTNYFSTGDQIVAGETVVKTEPSINSCDFVLSDSPLSNNTDEGAPAIGIPDQELIQMPVSRFNELLLSLTPEQSNLAKDIRRRGKNKQAARLCRKRKIDNISSLEGKLAEMLEEKSRLLNEQEEIVKETKELKSNIDMICEMLMKGLNEQSIGLPELSLLHHSKGQTLLVQK